MQAETLNEITTAGWVIIGEASAGVYTRFNKIIIGTKFKREYNTCTQAQVYTYIYRFKERQEFKPIIIIYTGTCTHGHEGVRTYLLKFSGIKKKKKKRNLDLFVIFGKERWTCV